MRLNDLTRGWLWCAVGMFAYAVSALPIASGVEEIAYVAGSYEELPEVKPANDDWPWWRGANQDGIAREQDLPLTFGEKTEEKPAENLLWKVEVPGRGLASPVTWKEQVFIASADEKEERQWLFSYAKRDGKLLWQTEIHQGGFMKDSHRKSTHAAATPVCDGERLIMPFIHAGSMWLTATDLAGKILWQTEVAPYDALYGFGSAPVIYKSFVIVLGDNDRPGSFMAAIHRKTGKVIWRIKRPDVDTYATPIIAHLAGKDQLIVGGSGFTWSYDPLTAKLYWKCVGPTIETTANSVAFCTEGKLKDTVFVSGGYPKPYTLMAVKADGEGDVTETHLKWTVDKQMPYVPSPLYADGLVYIMNDNGVASCLNAETGKSVWTKRLSGDFSASPVKCGERIYVSSEQGQMYVLKAGTKFQQLAKNDFGEGILATPTICGGRMYVRTVGKLVCVGNSQGEN